MATPKPRSASKPPRAPRQAPPDRAWQLLAANIAVLTAALNEVEPALASLSLDHKTVFVLSLLDTHDQPSTLAAALSTPKPTITALLKRAEAAGFIRRHTVPGDLRMFRLSITDAGKRARDHGITLLTAAFKAKLAHAAKPDLAGYQRAILAIAAHQPQPHTPHPQNPRNLDRPS